MERTLTFTVRSDDGQLTSVVPQDDFRVGLVLNNRYRLDDVLGRGGMGVVYLAHDIRLRRQVAVKVVRTRDCATDTDAILELREMFEEEARLGASLLHPAIAAVFDYGFHENSPYAVFEYIPGQTLREQLKSRGRFSLEEVRQIVHSLAQALDFAHAQHVIHRDLKPENIRVTWQGQFKVLDLGLATRFSEASDWSFAGTPAYASPEQAAEMPSDGRADQYALGLIVYELLTGRRPFESNSVEELLQMHVEAPPPNPIRIVPDLPEGVCSAILQALAKDPRDRFPCCVAFAAMLGSQFISIPSPAATILMESMARVQWGPRWRHFALLPRQNRGCIARTTDHLWLIRGEDIRCWQIDSLTQTRPQGARHLKLQAHGAGAQIRFATRQERDAWVKSLGSADSAPTYADPSPHERERAPIVLVKHRPDVPCQNIGRVDAQNMTKWRSRLQLKLRAAVSGAEAVSECHTESVPGFRRTECRLSGIAVRATGQKGRHAFVSLWFGHRIRVLASMILCFVLLAFLLELLAVSCTASTLTGYLDVMMIGWVATPELFVLGIPYSVLIGLAVLEYIYRWPQLVFGISLMLYTCIVLMSIESIMGVVNAFSLRSTWGLQGPEHASTLLLTIVVAMIPIKVGICCAAMALASMCRDAHSVFKRATSAGEQRAGWQRRLLLLVAAVPVLGMAGIQGGVLWMQIQMIRGNPLRGLDAPASSLMKRYRTARPVGDEHPLFNIREQISQRVRIEGTLRTGNRDLPALESVAEVSYTWKRTGDRADLHLHSFLVRLAQDGREMDYLRMTKTGIVGRGASGTYKMDQQRLASTIEAFLEQPIAYVRVVDGQAHDLEICECPEALKLGFSSVAAQSILFNVPFEANQTEWQVVRDIPIASGNAATGTIHYQKLHSGNDGESPCVPVRVSGELRGSQTNGTERNDFTYRVAGTQIFSLDAGCWVRGDWQVTVTIVGERGTRGGGTLVVTMTLEEPAMASEDSARRT